MAAKKAKKTKLEKPVAPPKKTTTDSNDLIGRFYNSNQNRIQNWLWIGVGVIAAVIAIFWGIGMKIQIENIIGKQGSDTELVNQTEQNWGKAFASQQANQVSTTSVRERLNSIVNQIISGASSSVSSSTSTIYTTTTPATTTKNNKKY